MSENVQTPTGKNSRLAAEIRHFWQIGKITLFSGVFPVRFSAVFPAEFFNRKNGKNSRNVLIYRNKKFSGGGSAPLGKALLSASFFRLSLSLERWPTGKRKTSGLVKPLMQPKE